MSHPGFILIIIAILSSGPVFATDLQITIDECEACHGSGGVSTQEDIPSLAGQDAEVLYQALEAFYFYERHCPTTTYRHGDRPKTPLNMCNVANTLGDEDKRALAEHFARL